LKPTAITLIGSDVDRDPLAYGWVTSPLFDTLTGSGSNLVYTPEPGDLGADSFTFFIADG
jgi:hypothetical protein